MIFYGNFKFYFMLKFTNINVYIINKVKHLKYIIILLNVYIIWE